MFDEFSSLENAKHTLRAMNENARQDYHNGSQPPFGYGLEEMCRKKNKKRLVLDSEEAAVVRQIFSPATSDNGTKMRHLWRKYDSRYRQAELLSLLQVLNQNQETSGNVFFQGGPYGEAGSGGT